MNNILRLVNPQPGSASLYVQVFTSSIFKQTKATKENAAEESKVFIIKDKIKPKNEVEKKEEGNLSVRGDS